MEPTLTEQIKFLNKRCQIDVSIFCSQFTERALGHELLTCSGPNIDFHIALARLRLQTGDYTEAEDSLNEALQIDFTVTIFLYFFIFHYFIICESKSFTTLSSDFFKALHDSLSKQTKKRGQLE